MWLLISFISFLVIISALYWSGKINKKKFNNFMGVLSGFSTIVIILSFIVTIQKSDQESKERLLQQQQDQVEKVQRETEKYWIDIEQLFLDNSPYLDRFYKQIYPNNENLTTPEFTEEELKEIKNKEVHVSQILYQIIENLLQSGRVSKDIVGWWQTFQSWSNSEIFRSNWIYCKNFYNTNTQEFINKLIKGEFTTPSQVLLFYKTKFPKK